MAGLGSSPFGNAPLGAAPTLPLTETGPTKLAPAKYFEQKNKQYPLTDVGTFVPAHWVDQAVVLATTIRRGSIPSAADLGHELHKIRHITARHTERVTQEIKRILTSLIDRQVLVLNSVEVVVRDNTTFAAIEYTNVLTTKRMRPEVPLA